jgi:hypothetical protein
MIAMLLLLLQDTCDSCHSDPFEEFTSSIHDLKGLDCKSCHGTDDIDPQRAAEGKSPHKFRPTFTGRPKDVVIFCGQCHAGVAEHFAGGKHASAMNCVSCHHPHRTEPAEYAKLAKWCFSCHKDQAERMGQSKAIQSMLQEIQERAPRMKKEVADRGHLRGVPGLDFKADDERVEEARYLVSFFREAQHGVDMKALQRTADRSRTLEEKTLQSLRDNEAALSRRPLYLVGFLAVWLATGILAALKMKRWGR